MVKILVIEDQDLLREQILDVLHLEQFQAVGASNGKQGVQLAREQQPDLIFCDVVMPELDGHGVLDHLRQDPVTAAIPFIFLTGKSDKIDLRQGMDLGADDYLTKPFTPFELVSAIGIRLKKQGAIVHQAEKKLEELRSSITLSLPQELGDPLNRILGYSKLLGKAEIPHSEVQEIASKVETAAEQLSRLIQNFLTYAELEIISTSPEQVRTLQGSVLSTPKSIVETIALQIAQRADRVADLQLTLQDFPIRISKSKLSKLAEALIDNAFKFSKTSTPVSITNAVEGDRFMLVITNQGVGMTADQIANLGPYQQFERKLHAQEGSGLGLSIAKRLVELHAGQLAIESIANEKITVRVTLPTVLRIKAPS
jgi:two-component system, sensor histidine kinase and response regulator